MYVPVYLTWRFMLMQKKKKGGKLGALPKRLEKLQLDIPLIKRKQLRAYVIKVNGFLMDSY